MKKRNMIMLAKVINNTPNILYVPEMDRARIAQLKSRGYKQYN